MLIFRGFYEIFIGFHIRKDVWMQVKHNLCRQTHGFITTKEEDQPVSTMTQFQLDIQTNLGNFVIYLIQ